MQTVIVNIIFKMLHVHVGFLIMGFLFPFYVLPFAYVYVLYVLNKNKKTLWQFSLCFCLLWMPLKEITYYRPYIHLHKNVFRIYNTPDLPFLNIHNPFTNENLYLDKHSRKFWTQRITLLNKLGGVVIVASA